MSDLIKIEGETAWTEHRRRRLTVAQPGARVVLRIPSPTAVPPLHLVGATCQDRLRPSNDALQLSCLPAFIMRN